MERISRTTEQLQLCFWNIEGLGRIQNMHSLDLNNLLSNHIISLYETWSESPVCISQFARYSKIESNAVRNFVTGRGSGGLLILYRNDMFKLIEIVHSHPNFIAVRLRYKEKNLLIISVYIPPKNEHDYVLDDLNDLLERVATSYTNDITIIGGDFNGRVASLDQEVSNLVGNWGNMRSDRLSKDLISNNRGEQLLEACSNNGYIVLNGRAAGDSPGNFTFANSQGGTSTIDLVFLHYSHIAKCKQLQVKSHSTSSHLPVELTLTLDVESYNNVQYDKLIWDGERTEEYCNAIMNSVDSFNGAICYKSLSDIIIQAARKCKMIKTCSGAVKNNKPWFDTDCKDARLQVKRTYRVAKQQGGKENWKCYATAKKSYSDTIECKKRQHNLLLRNNIGNCRNSKDFWRAVKSFRGQSFTSNQVSESDWLKFYDNLMPKSNDVMSRYEGNECEALDKSITMSELDEILHKCPSNKAAGPDGIPNEFFKYLPPQAKPLLLKIFNDIMQTEKMPTEWGDSTTSMLYKKGDPSDPINYRPIALLNHILKLFTMIIQKRLIEWADEKNKIPEAQGGFRAGRGCDDQIFCLNSAIQLNLSKKKNRVYALFVDFARAFPSVPHDKLWTKLMQLGVSGKIVRILSYFYENLSTSIKTEYGLTSKIKITEGLAQGEVLSPLLFNLYISDIESCLRNAGIFGVKITHKFNLQILLFADDMVILASTPGDLQKKIEVLRDYFENLGLKVNVDKTKIVVFRRGGKVGNIPIFKYGNDVIEVVPTYTYLGVLFSSSGVFTKAAEVFRKRGTAAFSNVWKIITKGQINSWESKTRLFESIVASTSLYCSQIWALNNSDNLEKMQSKFLRRALGVSKFVPDYILRLETGRPPIFMQVIKKALLYVKKLLLMDNERYAKKCFLALKDEANNGAKPKFNWVAQLQSFYDKHGHSFLNQDVDPENFISAAESLLRTYIDVCRQTDISRINASKRYCYYAPLVNDTPLAVKYLSYNVPFKMLSIASQLRLNTDSLYHNKFCFTFNAETLCDMCRLQACNTMKHFVMECIPYRELSKIRECKDINNILQFECKEDVVTIFYAISASLELRKNMLEG